MIRTVTAVVPARTLLLGATEALLVAVAFVSAVLLRFGSDADLVLGYEHGYVKIGLVICVFFLSMWYLDLYDGQFLCSRFHIVPRLLQVVGIMSILLAFVYYTYPEAQLGRSVLLLGVVLVLLLVLSWRQLFFSLLRRFDLVQRAVVVGTGPLALLLYSETRKRPELGIDVLGCVGPETDNRSGLNMLGDPGTLGRLVREHRISRVVVALEDRRGALPLESLLKLRCEGVLVEEGTELYEGITGKVALDSLCLSSLLFSSHFRPSRAQVLCKRVLSLCFAALGLAVSFPIMLMAGFAVWAESGSPVILRQERIGKEGKTFVMYKFRTMWNNADRDGNHRPAEKMDRRITRVGSWLRRTRIDELPQLYNILRGDMHFVGPRPFVPTQETELADNIPYYRHRWAVNPGATGWAQVNRGYCATLEDNIEKLAYDLFYIKNMSVGLDVLIIIQTLKIVLLGRGGR